MAPRVALADYVAAIGASPLAPWAGEAPWALVARAEGVLERLIGGLPAGYQVAERIAVHASATVETGVVLKGPAIVGPRCYLAAGSYVRGGAWLDEACAIGPGAELKSSFVFRGSRLAHFNFVGDSLLGSDVNLEAGSIVANYRNERDDREIRVAAGGVLYATGIDKFGALIGDGARIGANAVLAPGTLIRPGRIVPRLALIDQEDVPSLAVDRGGP